MNEEWSLTMRVQRPRPRQQHQCMSWLRTNYLTSSCVAFVALICVFTWSTYDQESSTAVFRKKKTVDGTPPIAPSHSKGSWNVVLNELIDAGIYSGRDFKNELGITPPYWDAQDHKPVVGSKHIIEWGPCFGTRHAIQWDDEIAKSRKPTVYPQAPMKATMTKEERNFEYFCRPGFLIIGAGKCGTSSLYHYITDHPRVLPASEKQIHYFKYYADRPMQWYLHHFPAATSFLASGALITGEASPGYLPYPDVVPLVKERLPTNPRIIVLGRSPVDRAYSSYRYNYVVPAMEAMRDGKIASVKRGEPDAFYTSLLFSFEEMVQAELGILRTCLAAPHGSAVSGARFRWGNESWVRPEYVRREKLGLEPMVDLDGFCYGGKVNKTVLRRQWTELLSQNPTKVIPNKNVHLIQSMVGRGLYTLPLEWWYGVFDTSDIYFVCTEELTDMTGEAVNKVGQFLGLPSFNFSATVSRGAYNVGNHRGYDTEVSWTKLDEERSKNTTEISAIPLSDAVRRELDDFYKPFNERLFQRVGRRCSW